MPPNPLYPFNSGCNKSIIANSELIIDTDIGLVVHRAVVLLPSPILVTSFETSSSSCAQVYPVHFRQKYLSASKKAAYRLETFCAAQVRDFSLMKP